MRILGIESSSLVASVAIVTDDVVTAEYTVNLKKTHSQTLLPMIDEMMSLLEVDLDTVDAIAVSGGPGSFIGVEDRLCNRKGTGAGLEKAADSCSDHGCNGVRPVWCEGFDLPHYGCQKKSGLYGALPLWRDV